MNFSNRIHPLVAVAAVSVTLVSAMGIAAITGVLPNSHGSTAESVRTPVELVVNSKPTPHNATRHVSSNASQTMPVQVAKNEPPVSSPKPVPHNSPIGIGVGAVIGGLLGNQVGSGDGKTLATIAGAIGGGYIGNEVAKKNQ